MIANHCEEMLQEQKCPCSHLFEYLQCTLQQAKDARNLHNKEEQALRKGITLGHRKYEVRIDSYQAAPLTGIEGTDAPLHRYHTARLPIETAVRQLGP
jgi:hypothetical protein